MQYIRTGTFYQVAAAMQGLQVMCIAVLIRSRRTATSFGTGELVKVGELSLYASLVRPLCIGKEVWSENDKDPSKRARMMGVEMELCLLAPRMEGTE
eukprot:1627181-Amphidinium_carterae.1